MYVALHMNLYRNYTVITSNEYICSVCTLHRHSTHMYRIYKGRNVNHVSFVKHIGMHERNNWTYNNCTYVCTYVIHTIHTYVHTHVCMYIHIQNSVHTYVHTYRPQSHMNHVTIEYNFYPPVGRMYAQDKDVRMMLLCT